MSPQTTYLVTGAESDDGKTVIGVLSQYANTMVIALSSTSSETWLSRLLCADEGINNSVVEPLHIGNPFTLKDAADTVAERWQRKVDGVYACPDPGRRVHSLDVKYVVSILDICLP
jgi:hypothetical protein